MTGRPRRTVEHHLVAEGRDGFVEEKFVFKEVGMGILDARDGGSERYQPRQSHCTQHVLHVAMFGDEFVAVFDPKSLNAVEVVAPRTHAEGHNHVFCERLQVESGDGGGTDVGQHDALARPVVLQLEDDLFAPVGDGVTVLADHPVHLAGAAEVRQLCICLVRGHQTPHTGTLSMQHFDQLCRHAGRNVDRLGQMPPGRIVIPFRQGVQSGFQILRTTRGTLIFGAFLGRQIVSIEDHHHGDIKREQHVHQAEDISNPRRGRFARTKLYTAGIAGFVQPRVAIDCKGFASEIGNVSAMCHRLEQR